MPTIAVVRSDEPDGRTLIQQLKTSGFTALLGSRISSWEPSNLPAGIEVTRALARLLAAPVIHPGIIAALIERTAFEHLMEACPEPTRDTTLAENVAQLYASTKPNPVHHAVAALIDAGVIGHVITTNYDDGLEQACRVHGGKRASLVQVIVHDPKATVDLTRPVIFKIHGCSVADTTRASGAPHSIVFRLGQEGLLDSWKRELLTNLLADRQLLVCGYSGLDFEICPELERLATRIKRLVWNAWKDPRLDERSLSPNAMRVMRALSGTALTGNMVDILGQLWKPFRVDPIPDRDVTRDLVKGIDGWNLDAWRLSLFASVGCATEGVRLAQELALRDGGDPLKRWTAFHGMGQALFHQGSYESSRDWYVRAASVAAANGLKREEFRAQMDAAEAERAAGRWLAASRRRERASAARRGPLHFGVFLRRALVAKTFYLAAKRLRLASRAFTDWFEATLRAAAQGAMTAGSWLDYQQCAMVAEELGLDRGRIFSGLSSPLPSQGGYRHLGYFVAECQSIRNAIDQGDPVPDLPELVWRLDRLWELGAWPEMTKLASTIQRVHGRHALSRLQRRRAREAFKHCEYRPWMRWFLRRRMLS